MAPSQTSTPAQCLALLPKLSDADADLRYMSLSDLHTLLSTGAPTFLNSDYHASAKIIDGVIHSLDDANGEVQSQAIKCVGALVLKLPTDILAPFVHRLSNIKTINSVDTSIPATALRTFITAFPPPIPNVTPSAKTEQAYSAISRVLIPRLLGCIIIPHGSEALPATPPGMLEMGSDKGVNGDAVDVLIELIRCFGLILDEREKHALQKTIMAILEDDRTNSIIKKKTVVAISLLAVYMPDRLLAMTVSNVVEGFRSPKLNLPRRKLLLTVVGALSKSVPHRIGSHLKVLAPLVLNALSEKAFEEYDRDSAEDGTLNPEVEDVREAALIALDGFLTSCSNDMRPYTEAVIASATRFVAYDPLINNIEDDEEMAGTQELDESDDDAAHVDESDADEYEEDGAMSDDDDSSWKLRRCAAKTLYAIIMTRSNGDLLDSGTLYDKIAPVLIQRFAEREENVRLEILTTLRSLVLKTGEALPSYLGPSGVQETEISVDTAQRARKRRRVNSNMDTFDSSNAFSSAVGLVSPAASPSPVSGPKADLGRLSPSIVRGVARLLKQPSVATKQMAITLLRDVVLVQHGGLSDLFGKIVEPLVDTVKGPSIPANGTASIFVGGAAAASGSKMRIEALQLVSAVCNSHSSSILSPHLGSLVECVTQAIGDEYYKVSSEALVTVESVIKVITPPRSAGSDQQRRAYLKVIYDSIVARATATTVDLEVRKQAIIALGVLLARTSSSASSALLSESSRSHGLVILQERLKNETTRLSGVKAVDMVTAMAADDRDLPTSWVRQIALELAAQLRKADRILKSASLSALRNLISNKVALASLDDSTVRSVSSMLIPLLSLGDLHLAGLSMICLGRVIKKSPQVVVAEDLNDSLCKVLVNALGGSVFDAFLNLVHIIGEKNVGQKLMQDFLQKIGVNSGDPDTVGKAIGTLLISGGQSVGVGLNDFTHELQTNPDPQRKCLALSILGEAGLRLGSASPLGPSVFSEHFSSKLETVPRAAAVALGRAGAGNIKIFLPTILSRSEDPGLMQYLSLHSIKEILRFAGKSRSDISPYTQEIWSRLLAASQAEDNKIIGAECIGRIAIIEPKTFLPALQDYLKDVSTSVRGMAIQAIRFTFADSDEVFDDALKPILIKMLDIMLIDPNIENRRLALGTLNSATHNKPEIILPNIGSLIPLVIKASRADPDLIREVQMGPFKHKVDDGLELRKSAYETLYSFIESAYSRMNHMDLFDRVMAGLEDEHEIKMLCNLMLIKLIYLDPEETVRRLDFVAEKYRAILSFKPKENSVKQEVEKATEASRGALKVTVRLHNAFPQASTASKDVSGQTWKAYWEWVAREFKSELAVVDHENRNQPA